MWLKILKPIDKLIDSVTMYRLLLYYLLTLLGIAVLYSYTKELNYSGSDIAASAAIITFTCYVSNKVLAKIFNAPINPESSLLSGLILALIIPPSFAHHGLLFMITAGILAMSSKYVLSYKHSHIFNPAAIAVVLTALAAKQNAIWWIGTASLLPFVIIGGLLVMRKINRFQMLISYLLASAAASIYFALASKSGVYTTLHSLVLSSPLFFLGFVMLSEPYTSPSSKMKQIYYGALVGILAVPQFHIRKYFLSPELALVIGNVFAFALSPHKKILLKLTDKVKIANNTMEFAFAPNRQITYQPGQYMEFTLPHSHSDSRGARRYFTLTSSPTEKNLKIGVKFYEKGSSFKKALVYLGEEDNIVASQLSGDFVLPKDKSAKLTFIAGGIGITPYASMLKFLIDNNQTRPINILYSAKTSDDFAYLKLLKEADDKLGIKTKLIISGSGKKLSKTLIASAIPDYKERTFFISGTHPMVEDVEGMLLSLGVKYSDIKTDFFPGYA